MSRPSPRKTLKHPPVTLTTEGAGRVRNPLVLLPFVTPLTRWANRLMSVMLFLSTLPMLLRSTSSGRPTTALLGKWLQKRPLLTVHPYPVVRVTRPSVVLLRLGA